MVLPTGAISMMNVNVQLNRPPTQVISLNDYDVRRLAGKPAGTVSMGDLRGKSNYLDRKIITVGIILSGWYYMSGYSTYQYLSAGSISDTSSSLFSGAAIKGIYYSLDDYANSALVFAVTGNRPNSNWETMHVNGMTFTRTSASYSYNSSDQTTVWLWSPGTNPFGETAGVQHEVTWLQSNISNSRQQQRPYGRYCSSLQQILFYEMSDIINIIRLIFTY